MFDGVISRSMVSGTSAGKEYFVQWKFESNAEKLNGF